MTLEEYLKELCAIDGISGDESEILDYICKKLDGKCEYKIDALGNVLAFVKGKNPEKHKMLFSAHMDEVGFIVTYINSDGTIKFSPVGGIDPRVVYGRRVRVGNDKILGVIGGKAVHNLSKAERENAPDFDSMFVDIGTDSKEQTEKLVSLGDSIVFESEFLYTGNKIKAKAIDDRAGCAIMLKLIEDIPEYDAYFNFVVQEEVGLRGATAAAFSVNPDFAIVLESTTASDVPSSSADKRVCELGKGAVVSFMDRHTIYDKELYKLAFETAEQNGIPCQTKTVVAGGNDAGAIHISHGGVRTAAISLPCRYLHSPSCVIDKNDFESAYIIAKKLSERIQKL